MTQDISHGQMGKFVGAKIRAARLAKKYTQSQLAVPDFSVSYISAIERGQIQPSLRALEILARRLGLSSAQMIPEISQGGSSDRLTQQASVNTEEERVELALLEIQICLLQGALQEAVAQLESLPTIRLQPRQKIQHYYLLGWAYLQISQLQKGEQALSEAARLEQTKNDAYSHLRILNLLGLTYAAMQTYDKALQAHQDCLTLLESAQPRDPFFTCHMYNSLGQHHIHLENFDQAVEMFQQALAITEAFTAPNYLQSTYWSICQHYAHSGEYHLAHLYAHKCMHLYSKQVDTNLKSEIYHYLGRALMKGDAAHARAYLEDALQKERNHSDSHSLASITVHLAEWFLNDNDLARAQEYAQKAHALVQPLGDTRVAVETLVVLGRLHYAHSRFEEGDTCFVAGLEMLERLGLLDEIAEQSARYAALLEEQGRAYEAFIYYRRAFQSGRSRGM